MSDGLTAGQRVALAVEAGGTAADAEAHGAPYASVKRGRAVKKQRPDLFEKVRRGEMSDSTAAKIMGKDKNSGPVSHPAAAIFPMMGPEDRTALKTSLERGYRAGEPPVLLHEDGRIIDGRNRASVCDELGIDYPTTTYEGPEEEILSLVISRNLARRQLNESQRAMVGAKLAKLERGAGGQKANAPSGALSQPDAAKSLNVSRRSIQRASKVLASGDKKLIEEVETGKKKVSVAARSLGTKKQAAPRKKADKAPETSPPPAPVAPRMSSIAHPTLADTAGQVTQFANRLAEISERVSAAELLAGFPTELREKIGLSVPQAAEFLAALWEAHVAATRNAADGPAASLNLN